MKHIFRPISIALIPTVLAACSTGLIKKDPVVELSLADQAQSIKYSGRGMGASAMLMSSMGPMGIAVGVAIDEGIGKDINKAFVDTGFDLYTLSSGAINEAIQLNCDPENDIIAEFCNNSDAIFVEITRMAFRSMPGDSDRVVADIEMNVRLHDSASTHTLSAKADELCLDDSESLDFVKLNGERSAKLLSTCLVTLVERAAMKL